MASCANHQPNRAPTGWVVCCFQIRISLGGFPAEKYRWLAAAGGPLLESPSHKPLPLTLLQRSQEIAATGLRLWCTGDPATAWANGQPYLSVFQEGKST